MWKNFCLILANSLIINQSYSDGYKIELERTEKRDSIYIYYFQTNSISGRVMDDEDYRIISCLLFGYFTSVHKDLRDNVFALGIHIFNLFLKNSDDKTYKLLNKFLWSNNNDHRIIFYNTKRENFNFNFDFEQIPCLFDIDVNHREMLIQRYSEIAPIIKELIPDSRPLIDKFYDYWFKPAIQQNEKNEENEKSILLKKQD